MRIGFDAKRYFLNTTGLGNYSRQIINGLKEFYPSNEYFLYSPHVPIDLASSCKIRKPHSFFEKKMSSLWRSYFVRKNFEQDKLDLYHGLSHEIPYGLKNFSLKKIVTIHDLILFYYPHFYSVFDRKIYEHKLHYSCEVSDKIIATSLQTKSDLINILNVPEEKIAVHYQTCHPRFQGASSECERKKIKEKYSLPDNYILYVGSFNERKNLANLTESFSKIRKKHNIFLVLVGSESEHKKKILAAIEKKGEKDFVKIISHVPSEDLPFFYQEAKLFVYPSLYEGFGIPVIEALFSKVPVITSKGSCLEESGGPFSSYIDPKSIENLADEMDTVLTDKDRQKIMIEEGYKFVQKFKQQEVISNLMTIYQSVL